MRVIVAARLSRIAKGQTGIDTQDEDSQEFAEENGHEIIATIADRKSGVAAMWDRPNLKPWVTRQDYMEQYDGIIAAKQDRLSRADWSDEARIRLWAEKHGKTLFIVDRNLQWPPRDPDDRERWNAGAEAARREWESTSKRYRRMQRALREQKYFVGKRSYGYRIVDADDHKTLAIDNAQATIVREIFRRYLAGESQKTICDWLVSENIPAPQPHKDDDGNATDVTKTWSSQAVRRILSNPIYIGRVIVKGQTYLRVPEIISPADFEQAQEIRTSRATRGTAAKEVAILTGVIKCEHGHPMYRMKGRKTPSVPDGLYYYCSAEVAPKGQRYLAPLAEADAEVNEYIETIGDLPNVIKKMTPARQYADKVAEIRQDIRELAADDDDFIPRAAELQAELKRYKELASKAAQPKPVIDRKPDGSVRTIAEAWESRDSAEKRAWLLEREWSVIVRKVPRLEMPTRKPGGQYAEFEYAYHVNTGELIADIEALGFPVREYWKQLAELPKRLGITSEH